MDPQLTSAAAQSATNYWSKWQADATPCTFPTLVASTQGTTGVSQTEVEIEATIDIEQLRDFAARCAVDLEAILITTWALVLRTYTGSASVSCGIIDEQNTNGLCATSAESSESILEIVRSTQRSFMESRLFFKTSFSDIDIFYGRDGRPFCNTAISFASRIASGQDMLEQRFDLLLQIELSNSVCKPTLIYSQSCLEASQATSVAFTFTQILKVIVKSSSKTVTDLNLVHPSNFDQLLKWNENVPQSIDRCVGDMFAAQVELRPANMAVHSSDDSFTYEQLDYFTSKLAQHLQSRGVGPEVIVLLCFPKSAWAVVAMISVIKAGGTILFFDASHPVARLQEIQGQVGSKIMLTAPQYADMWGWTGTEVIIVERDQLNALPPVNGSLQTTVTPSNMLYVIFTSGSTGKPKGCVIEHRQFLTGSLAQQRESGMTHTDRVLQLASFTFDVSILEIITSLISGACVCIPGDAARAKGPASCVQEFGVTWAFLTPSLVKLMSPEMVPGLRFLVLGGEPLTRENVETWSSHLQLANGYGPTECSIAATGNKRLSTTTDPANIGYPMGALCWIVDPEDHRRLVPVGAPGELLVHGPIVARGYFQDVLKTEAVFVDDFPWLPASGYGSSKRMYKTGDLARYNPDGTIYFLGRKDSQVKLRGLRIELGEIEHHIAVHELVRQAVVILPRQGHCKNQLTVVLSLKQFYDSTLETLQLVKSDVEQSIAEITATITSDVSQHLPAYMMPTVWIAVKSIPLTVSGKQNRVLVTRWAVDMDEATYNEVTSMSGTEQSQEAANPMEEQIQQLCSIVLDIPQQRIFLNRSFVNNGGDSILGMQLMARLRQAGISVSIQDMIQSKTLSELAERASVTSDVETLNLKPEYDYEKFRTVVLPSLQVTEADIADVYSLGPMQRGILLSQQRQAASYELRILCEILPSQMPIDQDRLINAWKAVVSRHTVLRTIFVDSISEDAPYDQLVLKNCEPYISIVKSDSSATVSEAVRSHKIIAEPLQPQVNFIVYETAEATYCMADINHALIDGVSILLLFRDLSLAYAGSLLTENIMEYSRYIGYLQQQDRAASLVYWKEYLADIAPCQFPLLNDDISQPNHLRELSCDLDGVSQLQEFCRTNNFTLSSVLQTAWALVLKSYTGLEDVAFGYLSAGRDAPIADVEEIVGVFINMLICRLRLTGDKTIMEFVNAAQEAFLRAMPHQHCSLADIQHEIGIREPLFNTVMSLQSALGEEIRGTDSDGSIAFKIVDEVDPTEYDISVNIAMSKEKVHLNLRHYTSKLSDAMAQNVFETFKHMISVIVNQSTTHIRDLSRLSEHDMSQIREWNSYDWKDLDVCVHNEVSKQVALRPHAMAVEAWDGKMSYIELDQLADKLAVHLSSLGVGPEVLVPMSFNKSIWTVVAQLAVLKAGGACVAFDPNHPRKRREELVRQCDAVIAVTAPAHRELFDGLVKTTVVVEKSLFETIAHNSYPKVGKAAASPRNPAFVVFTSGSTGKPKGIVLEHHALCTSAQAHGPAMNYGPNARILQFASYTFDVSIGETFTCLMMGGTLCIPNDDERMNDLAGVINRMEVNVAYLTPSVAGILQPSEVPSLKTLALGGEAVRAENITTWADKLYLVNIYGPAECSVWSTGLGPVPVGTSQTNIGFGLGALQWITEVGNPDKLCAIGCAGELLLEGPIVARGYLKDKEKTDAVFISDPAWLPLDEKVGSRRMYRTGDLSKYNSDGSISFIGRKDFQLKLHGQRIEMGEIEHNITSHESVANAVVIYPLKGRAKERLVAVVSLRELPASENSANQINLVNAAKSSLAAEKIAIAKSHLAERVPGYMMPAVWLAVETIPLSVNGKTDRTRVKQWAEELKTIDDAQTADDTASIVLPATKTEEIVRGVVSMVLGVQLDTISMDQSFVGLGGDSITAMQLSARSRSNLLLISVKDILLSKSLREIALSAKVAIQRATTDANSISQPFGMLSDADLVLLDYEAKRMGLKGLPDLEDGYPCSPMQQGMLISQAQSSDNYKFWVACEVVSNRADAPLTAECLITAWNRVVDRHAVLRTVFIESGSKSGLFDQYVLKKVNPKIEKVDSYAALIAYPDSNPVNYEESTPPHRMTFCEADGKVFFNLEISHTLIDGASMGVILRDMAAAYTQALPIGPLYRDYIFLLQENSEEESLKYWKTYLTDAEPTIFPKLNTEDASTNDLQVAKVDIPEETVQKLQSFSRENSVTLANIFQLAWALVIRTFSSSTDVVFGFLASGRDVPVKGIEEAVGTFINMLVCRVNVDNSNTIVGAAKKLQTDYLECLPYQHASLAKIQHAMGFTNTRLFNSILSLQRPMSEGIASESEIGIQYLQGNDPTEYDLSVDVTASDKIIRASIGYYTAFVSADQAQTIAATFSQVLNEIAQHPTSNFSAVELLTNDAKDTIFAWNHHGEVPHKVDKCIHEVIAERAVDRPDAPAIASWDECFNFGQLEEKATLLACYLQQIGVTTETKIPTCFDKSAWTIISMLAILKAGGAYVSMDPSHPTQHHANVIREVQANLILTGSSAYASKLQDISKDLNVICIDQAFIDGLPTEQCLKQVTVSGENAAFVCFTSGSTGKPKGIVLKHSGFTSMVAHNDDLGIRSDSRVFQFAAYTFDTSNSEIFSTLTTGACVCVPSEGERLNDVAGAMNRLEVNWTFMTPSMASLLSPADVPLLRTIALQGEQVRSDNVIAWQAHARVINSYGPAECTVMTSMADIGHGNPAATIGRGNGSLLWIADPSDDQRLAPIGCIGELLIEGPILARGYLDKEKTEQAFIRAPKWRGSVSSETRLYKTGDLVKYHKNGNVICIGRKDGRIKLNGQRIEMSEIERHIASHDLIQYAVVLFPKSGICKRKLVAVVAPAEFASKTNASQEPRTISNKDNKKKAVAQVATVRDILASQVPGYMVPTVWLMADAFPLTASKKIDRVRVGRWVEELDIDTYTAALDVEEEAFHEEDVTSQEKQLQRIIGNVLNLPIDQIGLNKSFLNIGGDSILAMQLVVQARRNGLKIGVKDIMRSKTISALALTAQVSDTAAVAQDEILDVPFELSPMQTMYFSELIQESTDHAAHQFNQSFLLVLNEHTESAKFVAAVQELVKQHPMLRARYKKDSTGKWTQTLLSKVDETYQVRLHNVDNKQKALYVAEQAQQELDIEHGPVFSAEFFNVSDGNQLIFLVAHHLIIDLVSWRVIIAQLEELLTVSESLSKSKSFPFQAWIKQQAQYASQNLEPEIALPYDVPAGDYEQWGMTTIANLRGDTDDIKFSLDKDITATILRGCHEALRTEPLDVFLSAAFQSFSKVFGRSPPAIFNEGHGREPWSADIDVNETVGWFTTMFPFHVAADKNISILDTIRQVKDQRKSLPRNGWSYWNSRFSNDNGKTAFAKHTPIEVVFNYLGVYQGEEQSKGLLRTEPFNKGDVGPAVRRFALIDINVYVLDGVTHFSLTFNRKMRHIDMIQKWCAAYQETLVDGAQKLQNAQRTLTLGDFPNLETSFQSLHSFQKSGLPSLGVPLDNIEDMYSCSPMQEGILLSQDRTQGAYQIETNVEISSQTGQSINIDKLRSAWQAVVDRHATLRTVFVKKLSASPFDQLVLRNHKGDFELLESEDETALKTLSDIAELQYQNGMPPHKLTIVKSKSGRIFCKLEISHALVDGTSMAVLISEWTLAYLGKLTTTHGPLYSDYIAYIQSQPKGKALQFWTKNLAEVKPCQFPVLVDNQSRPKKQLLNVDVSVPATALIKDFCQRHNLTLASIFRLAWAIVLRVYTGDDQVCFGYLASGREIPVAGIENSLGAFINMLVCSLDFAKVNAKKAVDSLEELQDEYLKALPWQHVSLAEIQHELGLSGQTLFNTVLSFQRRSNTSFKVDDIVLQFINGIDPTEYDIAVNISDSEEGVHVHMSYSTSRLSIGQAENVANTLSTVLASILSTPQSRVGSLNLFGKRDTLQVTKWNQHCPATVNKCVHTIFQENAKTTPHAPAIASWDGNFTYSELDTMTTQLANQLIKLGVGIDALIPICFEKSSWALIAMLAIMKAGAGYVPLDPAHPDDRLETIISQTGNSIILASESQASRMQKLAGRIVTVSESSETWSSKEIQSVETGVQPSNAAYTLFTSGSTGTPKGVLLEHSAVSSSIIHHGAEIGCSPDTRMFQFAAYTFDACILEIFTTLAYGGCICVPSDSERMSDIAGFITRSRSNTSFMTPSLVRILKPEQIPTMKTLILGGEALGQDNINVWADKLRLMNGYGPTETCVFCVMKTFDDVKDRNDILGHAVSSVSWIVQADDHNKLAPIGAIGMLFVQGPTLARGYLHDPLKTAGVFIENPGFLPHIPGQTQRVYNTGDLARYNSDGTITYLGRRDTMVKLRGQRIELAEIEHHVKANFTIASQVGVEVVLPQGQKERATLAAFLCLSNQGADSSIFLPITEDLRTDIVELQKKLVTLLPPYEIPTLFVPVGKMPTTTAGKLDRKALREAVAALSEDEINNFGLSEGNKRAPGTAMEKKLAEMWATVLKLPLSQIGADDSFFRLGGDSIMAMRLAANTDSGLSLAVSDVFRNPTLSDMALVATESTTSLTSSTIAPFELYKTTDVEGARQELASKCLVSVDQIEDAFPCTPLQEGLMVLSILRPGAYVAQKVFKLPQTMDLTKFKSAWENAAQSNPILRTAIVQTNSGKAVQAVLKDAFEWRTANTISEYIDQDKAEEIAYGRPLSRYAITKDRHFVWTAHHSIYDGWSMPLILEQVREYYLNNTAPVAPGFNTFIKYMLSTDEAASKSFWKKYLSGEKASSFPEQPAASHKLNVNNHVHHSLAIARKKGSEIPMATILRAAWGMTIARYADASDVVFGMTLSGRNCPVADITKMVGPTITTVPIRMSPQGYTSVSTFLKEVQDQSTDMIPHEHYGLQNISHINADTASATNFQNIFVVQPMAQFDVHHNEILGAEEVSAPFENFDTYPLIMECSLADDRVAFEARFDKAIISTDQVERLLRHFENIIRQLNDATEATRMEEISMFGEHDQAQILSWNKDYPEVVDACIPEIFAQQVKARPEALAVDAWDGKFTYAELDKLSTLFAHRLVLEGVGPEVLVPLCFEKSRWAIVTQMAIIKAGGGCVNLDPAHPLSRLELIIQDARAKVMLVAPQFADKFSTSGLKVISISEAFYKSLEGSPLANAQLPTIKPTNTAYVLFTSGSTGKPKGIVIEHGSLCTSSKAHGTRWEIGPETRLLQFAAYTFDVSCADIFTTLQRGGCICVPSENDRLNNLAGAINEFQCNWAFLTPTVASLLPAQGIPSLRKLVLGGEASTRDTIEKWHSVLDLIVCYGPAECSVYCSGAPPATAVSDPADLGAAIGALYWIADPLDYNKLMPVGCVGELLLEGRTVARGYLHDKEKTASAFIANPVWATDGTKDTPRRFYRTGDLVRYNSDGTIHFAGRRDLQVKIRGQRVELGEIEHAIRANHPKIAHVTVDAVRQQSQGNRQAVVAFLHNTTESGPAQALPMNDELKATMVKLQRALSESLPSYMVPALFIPMEQVPLTMNGKADRRQLRDLAASLTRQQALEYGLEDAIKEGPRTGMEAKLRDLWARILDVETNTIGVGDHFFRLGGDSILAMKLVAAAAEQGVTLSVKDFFRTPVLSEMASQIEDRAVPATTKNPAYKPFSLLTEATSPKILASISAQIGTTTENIADIMPATDFQKNSVAHALLKTRGFRNYLFLDGNATKAVSIDRLNKAFNGVVQNHEILRTVFALLDGQFIQVVLKQLDLTIEHHETAEDISEYAQALCKNDAAADLKLVDPFIKFMVVRQSEGARHRIIMRISHAQYDGVCLPQIWKTLQDALEGKSHHQPERSYSAYVEGVHNLDEAECQHYWKDLLKDSEMTNIVAQSKPSYRNVYNAHTARTLPPLSLTKQGITFATILKAAWSIVLASLSDSTDVVFGHVVSGRNLDVADIDKVVGACLTILPVRAEIKDLKTNLELLEMIQQQHAASMPFESYGSREIIRKCTSWPKYTRYSSILQHQNITEESGLSINGIDYNIDFLCPEADEADLAIKTTPTASGIEVLLISSNKSINQNTADLLIDSLCSTIKTLVGQPNESLAAHFKIKQSLLPLPLPTPQLNGSNGYINGNGHTTNGHATNGQANGHARTNSVKSRIASWENISSQKTIEQNVIAAWQEVLEDNKKELKLSTDSDFFGAGGDLVAVAALAARWQQEGYKGVTVEELIDHSELGDMVGLLSKA